MLIGDRRRHAAKLLVVSAVAWSMTGHVICAQDQRPPSGTAQPAPAAGNDSREAVLARIRAACEPARLQAGCAEACNEFWRHWTASPNSDIRNMGIAAEDKCRETCPALRGQACVDEAAMNHLIELCQPATIAATCTDAPVPESAGVRNGCVIRESKMCQQMGVY